MRISWEAAHLGAVANLRQVSDPIPAPAPGEAVVSVRAIGLNYADVFVALGLYEAANELLEASGGGAFCPGLEFCGDVVEVGEDVRDVSVGDRVLGFSRFGAYRTAVVSPTRLLRRLPESWSYEEGAALLVAGLTAWHGLVELGAAREGSRVLVHSAAGGCGCAALSICESLGCSADAVVGSEHKAAFLRSRFPGGWQPRILVRTTPREYASQIGAMDTQYDVVLDSLGGSYFSAALDRLAPMGRMIHFGATHSYGGVSDGWRKYASRPALVLSAPVSRERGGMLGTAISLTLCPHRTPLPSSRPQAPPPPLARRWLSLVPGYLSRPRVDPGLLCATNRAVIGFNLIWLTERHELLTRELDDMTSRGGLLRRPPPVGRTFGFGELPQALDYLRSGANVGKVVVTVDTGIAGAAER